MTDTPPPKPSRLGAWIGFFLLILSIALVAAGVYLMAGLGAALLTVGALLLLDLKTPTRGR